jgi:DHA1 family tetracycline resistance protein-like MFS transporter
MKKPSRELTVVLMAIFLDLVSNGILVPIVPQLLANPDSQFYLLPAQVPIQYSYLILGLLIATFPIIQFFSTPILGEYSDFYGRRKIITASLFGTGLSFVIFALGVFSKSLTLLFVSRIIGGISGGNLSVAQAAIADITPPKDRAKQFGLIGAAYGVGFIIGPVIGGLLSDNSLIPWFTASTPFWFAAILSFANAFLVFKYLRETRVNRNKLTISWHKAIEHIIQAYGMKKLRSIFATNFFFQASLALFATFFSVFLINRFSFNQVNVGYFIGYVGIWVVITQVFVLRFLTKKFDEHTLLKFYLIAGSIVIFVFCITQSLIGLLIVGALFALTNGISMAAIPSLASQRADNDIQGEILGINSSVQALAQASPPIIAGVLAATISAIAPIYIAGVMMLISWIVFITTVRKD